MGLTTETGHVREKILVGCVLLGVLITVFTESLSVAGLLTYQALIVAWGVMLSASVALLLRAPSLRGALCSCGGLCKQGFLDVAMGIWILLLALVTGAVAVLAAPTTYDSMTYHLARVAHWTQNQTVAFYPTSIYRQLYQPPWAEFAVLHLFLFSGDDGLANLVQWASMVGAIVGVSLVARQLGATVRGQVLSSFVCATIPMGTLQSTSTQNDYVVAFWLVCFVYALMSLEARGSLIQAMTAGGGLGLALLTKGTAYIFAGPFILWFLLRGRSRSFFTRIQQMVAILFVAIVLNGPQYGRNLGLFGSVLGPGGEGVHTYANQELSLPVLTSNVLRNLGLHVGTPWLAMNAVVERAIGVADSWMGIAPDDARSVWPGTRFAVVRPVAHEDSAGNVFHLLLMATAMLGALLSRDRRLEGYVGCLALAFVLFCLLFRWQPWHSRLHLPLFVLASPVVGVVLQGARAKLLAVLVVILAASSSYFLAQNQTRPLVGKQAVFRVTKADQRAAQADPAFVGAAGFIRTIGCVDLGLVVGSNHPEYLLWALVPDVQRRGRLEHVTTSPPEYEVIPAGSPRARKGMAAVFQPCAIMRAGGVLRETVKVGEQTYRSAWSQGFVQVLVPQPRSARSGLSADGAN